MSAHDDCKCVILKINSLHSLKHNNQIHFIRNIFFVFQESITAQSMNQIHPVLLAVHLPVLVPVPVALVPVPVPVKNMEHITIWIGNN